MSRIWIAGGEPEVRAAVAAAAERAGVEAEGAGGDLSRLAPGPGEGVVDLGLPPREWRADLVEREVERARELLRRAAGGRRVVRMSTLGASTEAEDALRRAAGVVEREMREAAVPAVALRVGLLLGECGLTAVLRRCVERSKLLPLPGIDRVRLEPLALTDFADYCVQAATRESVPEPAYELGCGEMLTGGLLVARLAENLGLARWCVPMPGWTSGIVEALGADAERPRAAAARWLDAMVRGWLPRGTSAWEHFDVHPTSLGQALADATGMIVPTRRREKGKFEDWRAPTKKGILWSKRPSGRR